MGGRPVANPGRHRIGWPLLGGGIVSPEPEPRSCQPSRHGLRETYLVARRGDSERIFEAQRAGVRARLLGTGMQPETADRWLDTWVLEATGRGLPKDGRYWEAGWDWIAEERSSRQ
jgi:hypothetical protein